MYSLPLVSAPQESINGKATQCTTSRQNNESSWRANDEGVPSESM